MKVYHGTTLKRAKEIKARGLQANEDARFDGGVAGDMFQLFAGGYWPKKDDGTGGYVFLTDSQEIADAFARLRAGYERMKPGTTAEVPYFTGGGGILVMKPKTSSLNDAEALPAVVIFDLKDGDGLESDPHGDRFSMGKAYRVADSVASKCVERVLTLHQACEPKYLRQTGMSKILKAGGKNVRD